ncbi:MAG: nuclear transport factor 2 family protein [Sulfuriferula sp.]|nr:nuclear transport factor 2 family protein [Sulfuriferula sp.]
MNTETINNLIHYYENLTPAEVENMGTYYSDLSYFRDPFNEVHTLAAIQAIFRKMYQQVDQPTFHIQDKYMSEQALILTWDFSFNLKIPSRPNKHIHGLSLLRFDESGKINYHRDYWDAAQELYEQLPGIGGIFSLMRKIIAH